jgi:beta-glucosidase-like glycosyl hydrolase
MEKENKHFAVTILFAIFIMFFQYANARTKSTQALKKSGDLKISESSCNEVENKLGQLLYVNVDGYGTIDGSAIHSDYIAMVNDLQIGGVLPHTDTNRVKSLKSAFSKLKTTTDLPLLIGVDDQVVYYNQDIGGKGFGLGYGAGFLKDNGYASDDCLSAIAYLDAFLHRSVGINQSLGPTIEKNKTYGFLNQDASKVAPKIQSVVSQFDQLGVSTTMKHFPYTPDDYNLHKKSEDTNLSKDQVYAKTEIFRDTANKTDFAMSTHLLNSNIDPENMVTFSKTWVDNLRKDNGFNGLLMTDGLFMIRHYPDSVKQMAAKWPQDQIPLDTYSSMSSIFAARAILAGHDLVLLESDSRATYRVFDDLMKIACYDKPVSAELRARIFESYDRISKWKKAHREQLTQEVSIPEELEFEAARLYNKKCPDKKAFAAFKEKVEKLGIRSNLRESTGAPVPPKSSDSNLSEGTR